MATVRLDEHRIHKLKPRKSAYDIRDRKLKGFGVRVLPSGAKRYFIHSQRNGQRFWKIVGRAEAIGTDDARDRARTLVASIQEGTNLETAAPPDTPFETVGDEVFRRYAHVGDREIEAAAERVGTTIARVSDGRGQFIRLTLSTHSRVPDGAWPHCLLFGAGDWR